MTLTAESTAAVIERLDKLIALQKFAQYGDRWVDVGQVATFLGFSRVHTQQRIVVLPGFPAPLGVGHPRWLFSEVVAWSKQHRRAA